MSAPQIAAQLDAALKAANLPIAGVSIGDEVNKATWLVHLANLQPSQADQVQAAAILSAFTPHLPPLEITATDVLSWASKKLGVSIEAALADIQAEKAK